MIPAKLQAARLALAQHPRCGAFCRTTGGTCRNAAMANGRCRMHGGMSTGAPKGIANPHYRHGLRTNETMLQRKAARIFIRAARASASELLAGLREPRGA